jgi:hypothetical protein
MAAVFFAWKSDAILFKFPEEHISHCRKKISKRFRENGILAVWTFDELEVTEAVTRAKCVNFGTVLTGGKFGKARRFSGRREDNHIETRIPWQSLGEQYTISTWVKLKPSRQWQSIIFHHRPSIGTSGIMLEGGNMVFSVPYKEGQRASYRFEKYGEFVNIVGVVDLENKKAYLYENGILKASITIQGVKHIEEYIEFGKLRPYLVYHPLDGVLDETVIWNQALSAEKVLRASHSKHSMMRRRYRIALRYVPRLYAANALSAFADALTRIIDCFNPLYHESRIFQSDLPEFNFILSRADIRHFNRCKNECLDKGVAIRRFSRKRKVEIVFNNKVYKARMALFGETPEYWLNPKKSFTVELESPSPILTMRRMVFIPPEIEGLLRPLVYRRIALRYKLPCKVNGLGIVRINGEFKGLYYFGEHPVGGSEAYAKEEYISHVLEHLPLPSEDVLKEYDFVRERFEPLLVRDKRALWSSRKVKYEGRKDRDDVERLMKKSREIDEQDAVGMVRNYLSERLLLNGNPSASYVIGNLGLDIVDIPDVRIEWISSNPEVIGHSGKITRPKDGHPVRVILEACVSSGNAVERKTFDFTVMPEVIRLPVLRLFVQGRMRKCGRTSCSLELIESGGDRRTGLLPGSIKLRGTTSLYYPKKSYSLKAEAGHRFFDFSDSKMIYLISSYDDPSLLKNKLCYDIFRSFSEENAPRFSPKVHFVEVFINDEYQGIYQLTERVDRFSLGLSKFNVKDQAHSVIYKAGHFRANFHWFTKAYTQVEPDLRYGEYWKPLEDLIDFTGSSSDEMFRKNISKWMDIDNVIDYYILVNFSQNKDERANMQLARNNEKGSRCFIVPWDFDKTFFGRYDRWFTSFLLGRLMRVVPGFKDSFKSRWNQLRKKQLAEETIMQMIDDIEADVLDSVPREFKRWPRRKVTHEEAVKNIKSWIPRRLLFLDEFINNL